MVIDTLIYDRTEADVVRWAKLNAKDFADMTAAERSEWLAGMKGAYTPSADMNRVAAALVYLSERLNACGYSVTISPKTDWDGTDIPTVAQLQAYLACVRVIRSAIAVPASTPTVPAQIWATSGATGLTVEKANDIEQILRDVDLLLDRMAVAWRHGGAAVAGMEGLIR